MEGTVRVEELTRDQPFCAGVVLRQSGGVMVTLNTDGLPPHLVHGSWRIGGVGGGQEPGETIAECARREAREEICSEVRLVPSPVSFFHDIDTGEVKNLSCSDFPAPLLLERKRNPRPDRPYRPGLPTGPFIYFGLFFADAVEASLQPGDDVEGLLTMPVALWPTVDKEPTLQELLDLGATVIWRTPHATERRVWVSPDESFRIVFRLLSSQPDLLVARP